MQQWSAGLRRPLQPYQGEKTEPMKPMTEMAWSPSSGDAVDVPPGVAVGRDGQVEARSARIAAAACRPESAAIGMPGPGCTPPPAR